MEEMRAEAPHVLREQGVGSSSPRKSNQPSARPRASPGMRTASRWGRSYGGLPCSGVHKTIQLHFDLPSSPGITHAGPALGIDERGSTYSYQCFYGRFSTLAAAPRHREINDQNFTKMRNLPWTPWMSCVLCSIKYICLQCHLGTWPLDRYL